MTESTFSNPTQFEITSIKLDGQDAIGLFYSISIYEDIYKPVITGNIVITDSDGAGFIEEYGIEFIEEIEFSFKAANGTVLEFKGFMNGQRNEIVDGPIKIYTIDFTSKAVRKNEQTFITNSYKDTAPEEIVNKMVQKLDGTLNTKARGERMMYLGSRKRPIDIIKYVCTHGLTQENQATQKDDSKEEQAKGTTGFLFWETLDGFKFESINEILSGKAGQERKDYKTQLTNNNLSMEDAMKSIVAVEFKQIGDFQTKLRSGAFGAVNISFDMDTGEYKEYNYWNGENMTDKQKEALPDGKVTRYFMKPLCNQKFTNSCEVAKPSTGDQSRKYLNQNAGRQNTFSDQTGQFTLYPQFNFRAGDSLDVKISKVKDGDSEGGYDKKHSGKYVIQAVGHHLFNDGRAYTKVKTIRSTIQQNDSTSQKGN